MSREKVRQSSKKNNITYHSVDRTPHPSTEKKLGHSGHDWYEAIEEQIDNSLDAAAKNINIVIAPDGKKKKASYSIEDDGIGMSAEQLSKAVAIGWTTKTGDSTMVGEYGFGMETSCGRLGNVVEIETQPAGSKETFRFWRDDRYEPPTGPDMWKTGDGTNDSDCVLTSFPSEHPSKSYTKITIQSLSESVTDRAKTLRGKISKKYRKYLEKGIKIRVNNTQLNPRLIEFDSNVAQIRGELDFKGNKVAYHFGLLTIGAKQGQQLSYGLELYKYDKLIESDVRNIMGLSGTHGLERDVFGQIQLDHFSTDHTKLKFTRDDDFNELDKAIRAHAPIKKFYRDVKEYNSGRKQFNPPTEDLQNKMNKFMQKISTAMSKNKLLDTYKFNKPLKGPQIQPNGALVPGQPSTPPTTPPAAPTNPPNPNPKPRSTPKTLPSIRWDIGDSYINMCATLNEFGSAELAYAWSLTNEVDLNVSINIGSPLYDKAHNKHILLAAWVTASFMECLVKEKKVTFDEALTVQQQLIYYAGREVS